MSANIKKAISELGTCEFSRWMLPDGSCLDFPDYQDHRWIGQYCTESWLEFIERGCVTTHYSREFLWIRVNGQLNTAQRNAFRELIEQGIISPREILVQIYDGREYCSDCDVEERGAMAELFLTDTIAYQMMKNEEEYNGESDHD